MQKMIIFDLDGTLLDTLGDLHSAVNHALSAYGLPERTLAEVRQFVGNGVRLLMERATPPLTAEEFEAVFAEFRRYYVSHCRDTTAPYAGVLPLLRELKARGVPMAVVSNKLQAGVSALCDDFFAGLIDVCVGEREGVRRKPAPDMVWAAMQELEDDKDTAEWGKRSRTNGNTGAIYVGDSDVDIATARAAGLRCVSVSWGFRSREFLLAHGATTIIDRPEELLALL